MITVYPAPPNESSFIRLNGTVRISGFDHWPSGNPISEEVVSADPREGVVLTSTGMRYRVSGEWPGFALNLPSMTASRKTDPP